MSGNKPEIPIQPLSAESFSPFGDIIDLRGDAIMINEGLCERYSDLAKMDFVGGRAGISLFNSQIRQLPYKLNLMERHPLGSQAFLPLSSDPFLVIVAPDENGLPGRPLAFMTQSHQGINFHRNTWHGVLTPVSGPGLFAVVDRIAEPGDDRSNLEVHTLNIPYSVS